MEQKSDLKKNIDRYKSKEIEDLRLQLEKQFEMAIWIKAIASIIESVSFSKLLTISENLGSRTEMEINTGIWIQAVGQIIEAIGVSQQVSTTDGKLKINGEKMALTGDVIQIIGTVIEVEGGLDALKEGETDGAIIIP